jgi:hypothetical protein
MVFVGFEPFPAVCPTLSAQQNELCDALLEFLVNDYHSYKQCRRWIEENFIRKMKYNTFDNIKACKAYENLLTNFKKYIVEEFNKPIFNNNNYGTITTRTLNKDVRRHLTCLLVNHFLDSNKNEVENIYMAHW